jgi:hypothetical protein
VRSRAPYAHAMFKLILTRLHPAVVSESPALIKYLQIALNRAAYPFGVTCIVT